MNLRRIGWLVIARNREFYRDQASLAWNFIFPFLMVAGIGFIFSERGQALATVGVLMAPVADVSSPVSREAPAVPEYLTFRALKYLEFVELQDLNRALELLRHHKIDLLVDPGTVGAHAGRATLRYWVNETSPKGYLVERFLHGAAAEAGLAEAAGQSGLQGSAARLHADRTWRREALQDRQTPYTEWMFPGFRALNLMWMSLYGVGWSIVRYRHNGVLKRYRATPVTAFEYLAA